MEEIEDTSGFYRLVNNELQFAPNSVYAPSYTLLRDLKDRYQYPVDGWQWYDQYESNLIKNE
jgi:hypothetical protein